MMHVLFMIGKRQNMSQSVIILGGVVIGYLFQAGVTALKYLSDDGALREITVWLMGGMWGASWTSVMLLLPIVLVCFLVTYSHSKDFNSMSGGDDVAKSLGVDVEKFRFRSLIIMTLCTSACIAFTGIIGFIGLMAPHICRILIGNDQRYLIPASALMGGLVLLISDSVGRVIMAPAELPVGVIMYIIGGIFFVYLIWTGQGRRIE